MLPSSQGSPEAWAEAAHVRSQHAVACFPLPRSRNGGWRRIPPAGSWGADVAPIWGRSLAPGPQTWGAHALLSRVVRVSHTPRIAGPTCRTRAGLPCIPAGLPGRRAGPRGAVPGLPPAGTSLPPRCRGLAQLIRGEVTVGQTAELNHCGDVFLKLPQVVFFFPLHFSLLILKLLIMPPSTVLNIFFPPTVLTFNFH